MRSCRAALGGQKRESKVQCTQYTHTLAVTSAITCYVSPLHCPHVLVLVSPPPEGGCRHTAMMMLDVLLRPRYIAEKIGRLQLRWVAK